MHSSQDVSDIVALRTGDIYDILAAAELPLEPWARPNLAAPSCVNASSVGWNTSAPDGSRLHEVPCPSIFRAHPEWFVCAQAPDAPPGSPAVVWPCTFDLMYQKRRYSHTKRFSTGVAHLCWTGSDSVAPAIARGMRAWLAAVPNASIVSLSEEDGGGPGVDAPGCPADDALRRAANTTAAPLFKVLNQVAAELEPTHPHVRIKTLAYNAALEYKPALGTRTS